MEDANGPGEHSLETVRFANAAYECVFCGLNIGVRYYRSHGDIKLHLFCVECGTPHRLDNREWLVFRVGPYIRSISDVECLYYLQRVVDEPYLLSEFWGEKEAQLGIDEARKIIETGAKLQRSPSPYQTIRAESRRVEGTSMRISLMPSRRERWRRLLIAASLDRDVITPGSIIASICLLSGFALQDMWNRLPHSRRRRAEERAEEEASLLRQLCELWNFLPLHALTRQAALRSEERPGNEEIRLWLSGVSCGHCGTSGSLLSEWKSIRCPLCNNAPLKNAGIDDQIISD